MKNIITLLLTALISTVTSCKPKEEEQPKGRSGILVFDAGINYPYGVNPYITDINVFRASYHGKELTILLGTADTIRNSSLRTTPQADAQGLNRFERGNNFFTANQQWAAGSGTMFRMPVMTILLCLRLLPTIYTDRANKTITP